MMPQVRTVGELIEALKKYPPETRLIGWNGNDKREVVVHKNDFAGEKPAPSVVINVSD